MKKRKFWQIKHIVAQDTLKHALLLIKKLMKLIMSQYFLIIKLF